MPYPPERTPGLGDGPRPDIPYLDVRLRHPDRVLGEIYQPTTDDNNPHQHNVPPSTTHDTARTYLRSILATLHA